jgi:hypothetical protein
MAPGQDWCLQCGAAARRGAGAPGWRSAATILGVSALLALGAAAAGYAALHKKTHKPPAATTVLAQATPTPTPATPGTPTTIKPVLPTTAVKPPKIPLTTSTPQATPTTPATGGKTNTTGSTNTTPSTGGASTEPTPVLLDTNAASTYNPYNYSASNFGDPSLTIDGDGSTGWSALVDPATAPRLAEGVLIDLKTARRFASAKLATSSPGMVVGLYGANGKTAPTSITDSAWVALSHARVVGKKHITIKLLHSRRAFRFITLWISKAPASSVGTPTAPGHVSVNELELFAAE